ncbi:hypothetical protein SNE25_03210 [Mucilaginibacter sabulilitoris]|uniref:Outer membrane protein beta-barrel domain-containing protein n=1 Tax=Mucilaginibacter sabulilitoris TaxID=1173583 RepID=A0ABZ0TMZ0_9SPHI|nr:hypothetical protein [Mucilaginibacter sabulilitoris]WPU94529.1 hypothetical protein SNE25_03210 [Mucilaginibacter sabulilitoris]
MKKFILFLVLAFACITVKAQSGYNYYEWGWGGGIGYGRAYADTKRQDYHPIFNLNIAYNYNPFLPIALELQFGTLSGGGRTRDKDASGRIYKNAYKALILHADQQMGDLIDYSDNGFLNVIKNFYIGTGIGAVSNNIKDIQRTNLYSENDVIGSPEGFQGKDKSINFLIPLRVGYEFKIYDNYDQVGYTITIGYEHNYTFSEGLDGYNDNPAKYKNNAPDQYAHFTLGFRYNFGNTVSYNKLVRNFRF